MDKNKIKKIARKKYEEIENLRNTNKYKMVIGKLIAHNLLENNRVKPYRGPVDIKDVLEVANIEQRILEILPAILLKKPKLFRNTNELPVDIKNIVTQIRKNLVPPHLRGIAPEKYLYWIDKIGRKNIKTSTLKTFRFTTDDLELLKKAKQETKLKSEIDVIRAALKKLG